MATSSTSPAASTWPPTSPAETSTVRSPASSCALATPASTPSTKWNGAGAGERGERDAVGVLGRFDLGAGADAERRRTEVDDEHRRRHRRQRQPRGTGDAPPGRKGREPP